MKGKGIEQVKYSRENKYVGTPKLRYNESRYSEIRDIVNKSQLPKFFTPYIVLL